MQKINKLISIGIKNNNVLVAIVGLFVCSSATTAVTINKSNNNKILITATKKGGND